MDFLHLQLGSPTGMIPLGIFQDPDYILPQERTEFVNLYRRTLALADKYWETLKQE